ncbi:MAG: efflux RND transporter permease subunit [Phycisphaerae bacterium]
MFISNAAIRNRTTVFVVMVMIILAGVVSYVTLPRESAPDVKIPNILITTIHDGVSPVDIESTITAEIETELSGLKGVKEITSTSRESVSTINVEFMPDIEIEEALQRVKDKVDLAKADLPIEAEEPVVKEINIAEFPIMMVNIHGDVLAVQLKEIADRLEDEVEKIPGVLGVDVLGTLEREIRVEIQPERVARFGLTLPELLALIPSENVNQSAGGLDTEQIRFNFRIPAEFENPENIDKLILAMRGDQPIFLTDVGRVIDTFKDRQTYARLNGEPSVTLAVRKRVGANIVEIADGVRMVLAEARKHVPEAVKFTITSDRSDDIRMMVKDLENNILTGLLLVVGVLMIFMGIRNSLIVALAIPMSMLMSFAIIEMVGLTLNMIVLFSLILALGMLVDNAIVIVENIYRHMHMDKSRAKAAMDGTAEVAWPVITSTATTLAAFTPLLFWPGIMGDFMKYLPMTVMIVLSSSLFVAMVINPVICSIFAKPKADEPVASDKPEGVLVRAYQWMLQKTMKHRFTTLVLGVMLLLSILVVYQRRGAGGELFPDIDPAFVVVNLRAPQGTNIDHTNELALEVEKRIGKFARSYKADQPYFKNVVTNVGSAGGNWGGEEGPHIANVNIMFQDFADRERPSGDFIPLLREELKDLVGAEVKVDKQEEGPPTGSPVTVRIIGEDMDELNRLSREAIQRLKTVPNLVNLRSDLEAARPEIQFIPDRQRTAILGLDPNTIGTYLKAAIFGWKVGTFRQFNDDYDITIRMPENLREGLEPTLQMQVPNERRLGVALSSLGRFRLAPGYGTIHRIDQKRVVTITGDNEGRLGPEVLADAQAEMAELDLPDGYEIRFAGEKEEQDKASAFLLNAGVIAILAIVAILVAQFNTLSVPLIIMTTVLLSTIGVFTGLLVMDLPFGIIMTGVGVISLAGVVVNNAIVLLDYTRQLQRRGLDLVEAVVQAGITRLRPVLLTATTTILGLIPMLIGVSIDFRAMELSTRSESSQWWQSMAAAVVFGLGFATVLTLLAVPALYVMLFRLASYFGLGGLHHSGEAEKRPQPVLEDY